jgi:hypothetical protein
VGKPGTANLGCNDFPASSAVGLAADLQQTSTWNMNVLVGRSDSETTACGVVCDLKEPCTLDDEVANLLSACGCGRNHHSTNDSENSKRATSNEHLDFSWAEKPYLAKAQ